MRDVGGKIKSDGRYLDGDLRANLSLITILIGLACSYIKTMFPCNVHVKSCLRKF